MSAIQKKIAFYVGVVSLIRDEEFIESSAEALVGLYEEIKADVFITDVSVKFLQEAYEEYHDNGRDLEIIEALAETAFKDLYKHMRSSTVRTIFQELTEMSGTCTEDDLYVCMTKVRPLSHEADGVTVVTLVVNSLSRLQSLLDNDGTVEVIHSV